MKKLFSLLMFMILAINVNAQNIIIQQNNNTQRPDPPKTKIVEKIVEVEKVNPKPTSPVCILGYLYVFPDKFSGDVNDCKKILKDLNNNHAYGFSDWRMASMSELNIMWSNKKLLPEIMTGGGYLSNEFVEWYDHYGTGIYPLHRILDTDGRHWQVKGGCGTSGILIPVRTDR